LKNHGWEKKKKENEGRENIDKEILVMKVYEASIRVSLALKR
jgi:hypothetical protein